MSDFLGFLFVLFVGIFGMAGAIFLLVCLSAGTIEPAMCKAFERQTGLQTSYEFWGECMVKTPQGIMTKNAYLSNQAKVLELTVKNK